MEHNMKLSEEAFNRITSGKKTIEIRLFDEKRQKLNLKDTVVFSKLPHLNEKIKVEILSLLRYQSFKDLLNDFDMSYFGYPLDYPIEEFVKQMYTIYPKEKEDLCGVLGIKIRIL